MRAYISLKYPFLAIHAKGGESISPKQKDRTTTNLKNFELRKEFFNLVSYFYKTSNWSPHHHHPFKTNI
jgi:transcription elongation factor GreA-like protein